MAPLYARHVPRCRKRMDAARRWWWREGGGNDNSQYEPTAQIDTSNLLRAIRKAGRDCRYRRYESKSEREEGTAGQHLSVKPEEVPGGRRGTEGRGRENRTFIGNRRSLLAANHLSFVTGKAKKLTGGSERHEALFVRCRASFHSNI